MRCRQTLQVPDGHDFLQCAGSPHLHSVCGQLVPILTWQGRHRATLRQLECVVYGAWARIHYSFEYFTILSFNQYNLWKAVDKFFQLFVLMKKLTVSVSIQFLLKLCWLLILVI